MFGYYKVCMFECDFFVVETFFSYCTVESKTDKVGQIVTKNIDFVG